MNRSILKQTLIGLVLFGLFSFQDKNKPSYRIDQISIFQDNKEIFISGADTSITIDKKDFSIRFCNKEYDGKNKKHYSTRVAAFLKSNNLNTVKIGQKLNESANFNPGTGYASGQKGTYEHLYVESEIDDYGHHYLCYEKEDKRVKIVEKLEDGFYRFSFDVNTISCEGKVTSIEKTIFKTIYLIVLSDLNLNGIVDKHELTKITLNFK